MIHNAQKIIRFRRALGYAASIFFVLGFIAVLDGIQYMFRYGSSNIILAPGESTRISGWIPENSTISKINFPPSLAFDFHGYQHGYYMGGNQWLGAIAASIDSPPGNFTAQVLFTHAPPQEFHITVVPTSAQAHRLSPSVLIRTLSIHPYTTAGALIAAGLASAAAVYALSIIMGSLLAAHGFAETYVDRQGRLMLPWGSSDGLAPGTTLPVFLPTGSEAGRAHVSQVWEGHARAFCEGVRGVVFVRPPVPYQ